MDDKLAPPEQQMEILKSIIQPVCEQIVAGRMMLNGIVLVVHNPPIFTRNALKKVKIKVPARKTSVTALSCDHCAEIFGNDPISRKWYITPPQEDEIKVLLFAGRGSALLTFQVDEEENIIKIDKVANKYGVQQPLGG